MLHGPLVRTLINIKPMQELSFRPHLFGLINLMGSNFRIVTRYFLVKKSLNDFFSLNSGKKLTNSGTRRPGLNNCLN